MMSISCYVVCKIYADGIDTSSDAIDVPESPAMWWQLHSSVSHREVNTGLKTRAGGPIVGADRRHVLLSFFCPF